MLLTDDKIDFINREMSNVVLSIDGRKEVKRQIFTAVFSVCNVSADYPVFVNKQNGIIILWLFQGNCNLRNLFALEFSDVKSDFLLKFVVFLIIFIKIRWNYNRAFFGLCVGGFNSELFKEFFLLTVMGWLF